MANLEFYIQEINFESEGEIFTRINKPGVDGDSLQQEMLKFFK